MALAATQNCPTSKRWHRKSNHWKFNLIQLDEMLKPLRTRGSENSLHYRGLQRKTQHLRYKWYVRNPWIYMCRLRRNGRFPTRSVHSECHSYIHSPIADDIPKFAFFTDVHRQTTVIEEPCEFSFPQASRRNGEPIHGFGISLDETVTEIRTRVLVETRTLLKVTVRQRWPKWGGS